MVRVQPFFMIVLFAILVIGLSSQTRNRLAGDFVSRECSDGIDNDGDFLVDSKDPDCAPGKWNTEFGQCFDGIDNDKDFYIDSKDKECPGSNWVTEFPSPAPSCGNGIVERGEQCDSLTCADGSSCVSCLCTGGSAKLPPPADPLNPYPTDTVPPALGCACGTVTAYQICKVGPDCHKEQYPAGTCCIKDPANTPFCSDTPICPITCPRCGPGWDVVDVSASPTLQ